MNELIQFFIENRLDILDKTLEHLWLTGVSVFIAIVLGVSLGILLTRRQPLVRPVLGFANLIQTIPSIALLGFMIPLLGIGPTPAIVALFLYALLPIIRNTYTGIDEVAPEIREAGRGLGMTDWQVLSRVEIPLALPTIFAGIRTATVINVGVATLCAFIAAGGLGEFIFTGLALNNTSMILTGAIPAALLAILLDNLLGMAQRLPRKYRIYVIIAALGLLLAGLIAWLSNREAPDKLIAGHTSEFMERKDGWKGLKETYELEIGGVQMDVALLYKALQNGRVDVISGYATDGRIKAYNLRVLEDDLHFFPPYCGAPLVRTDVLERHPELRDILNQLAPLLTDDQVQQLNYEVDHQKDNPREVARRFLEAQGFPTERVRNGTPDLIIGGKNFTEQFILAEMMSILIENQTPLDVEVKTGLGGTIICFEALLADEIQLYPEYTGTGFLALLQPDDATINALIRDRDKVYDYVHDQLDSLYQLQLLEPYPMNNTYALMMREELAEELGIESISDLAAYLKE
jgi:osmoprotectant transport system permease protein